MPYLDASRKPLGLYLYNYTSYRMILAFFDP